MTNELFRYIILFVGGLISVLVTLFLSMFNRHLDNQETVNKETRENVSELKADVSEIRTDVAVLKNNIK